MDICHLYKFEKDARQACNDFFWDYYNNQDIENPKIFTDYKKYGGCSNKCVIGVNVHWFLSEYTYETWCKGRDYILDGQLMHSGYPVK